MKKTNDYKCPEIENIKILAEEFFKTADEFIEKMKQKEK